MWENELLSEQVNNTGSMSHKKFVNIIIINTLGVVLIFALYLSLSFYVIFNTLFLLVLLLQTAIYMLIYNLHMYSLGIFIFFFLHLVGTTLISIPNEICIIFGFVVLMLAKNILGLVFVVFPYGINNIRFIFKCRKWYIPIIIVFTVTFIIFAVFCVNASTAYYNLSLMNIKIIFSLVCTMFMTISCFLSITRINILKNETQASIIIAITGTIMMLFSNYLDAYNDSVHKLPYGQLLFIIIEWVGLFLISCSIVRNWQFPDVERTGVCSSTVDSSTETGQCLSTDELVSD